MALEAEQTLAAVGVFVGYAYSKVLRDMRG